MGAASGEGEEAGPVCGMDGRGMEAGSMYVSGLAWWPDVTPPLTLRWGRVAWSGSFGSEEKAALSGGVTA